MIVKPISDRKAFDKWIRSRPALIKQMILQYPPDRLYRMNTGHRVTIYSYAEDGTVTIEVRAQYNALAFERQVFGVDPATLVECDPPKPDEPVGAVFTNRADVEDYLREHIHEGNNVKENDNG